LQIKKINPNLFSIVDTLNKGGYHDGISLGKPLGITRAAVCKLIKKLKDYNVKIDSIKNKGYALREPFILLDKSKIKQYCKNSDIDIDIFESLPSTNDYLKLQKHLIEPTVYLAEQQTHGRGRLNRHWYSPFGQNIYFSCLYYLEKDVSELAGLSLIISLAVAHLLKQYHLSNIQIKWPNDVLYKGSKLSGNLIDVEAETCGLCRIIIGIGININMLNDERRNITQKWTSLREISQQYIDRNQTCAQLIEILIVYLKKFAIHGLGIFMDEWKSIDLLMNKTITLKCGAQEFTGRVMGINHLGNLLVEVSPGIIKKFSSGEASIVKN